MELDQLIAEAGASRGSLKRAARRVDEDPQLRAALEARVGQGSDWSSKRLLRRALDRSEGAQLRSTPVRVDESFTCTHCGAEVAPGGARVRDHCPACLRSRHLDVVPGDRQADCGGRMDPVGVERIGDGWVLRYVCARCGHTHRVRAHPSDDINQIARISAAT
jgi:DNA-directed RNA polymerase subunit RPC12/RpoP